MNKSQVIAAIRRWRQLSGQVPVNDYVHMVLDDIELWGHRTFMSVLRTCPASESDGLAQLLISPHSEEELSQLITMKARRSSSKRNRVILDPTIGVYSENGSTGLTGRSRGMKAVSTRRTRIEEIRKDLQALLDHPNITCETLFTLAYFRLDYVESVAIVIDTVESVSLSDFMDYVCELSSGRIEHDYEAAVLPICLCAVMIRLIALYRSTMTAEQSRAYIDYLMEHGSDWDILMVAHYRLEEIDPKHYGLIDHVLLHFADLDTAVDQFIQHGRDVREWILSCNRVRPNTYSENPFNY